MKILIDKNHLLTIFNENIPQTKEYTYHASGYTFSDFDKGIIVLHKKDRKIVNMKNLGDNMSVVYLKKPIQSIQTLDKDKFAAALTIFHGFNEETGELYYFIPGTGEKEAQERNEIFKKLKTEYEILKDQKGMILNKGIEDDKRGVLTLKDSLSYFFGLIVLYGKFDAKKGELTSMKIQIPIFGGFMTLQEDLDVMIKRLQAEGIFLKADKLPNKNGIVYQISSNDYELLETFAKWYEPVEKFEKITKREFTEEMKTKLIEFINTSPEIPQDGKAEVLKQIQEGAIKLLTK